MDANQMLDLAVEFLQDSGVMSILTAAMGAAVIISLVGFVVHKLAGGMGKD